MTSICKAFNGFYINVDRIFDSFLNDAHVLSRSNLICGDNDFIVFQTDEVSNNFQVCFIKTFVNISNKDICLVVNGFSIICAYWNNNLLS